MTETMISSGFPKLQKDYYKVYVRSCTYNQSPYIEDCLNGVALQKTTFPFVHHVIDDCSTDGEQKVIKAWIERECDLETAEYYDNDICTITLAKNKSNPNCTLAVYFLKRNIYKDRGKREELYSLWREVCQYEAICEGDDYWIDNQKLQDQVDYLIKNPSCRYVFTARYVENISEGIKIEQRYKQRVYNTHDILSGFNPGIQNIMMYANDIQECIKYEGINGDRLYPYIASLKGQIHYIDKITSTYRMTGTGVSTQIPKEKLFEHCSTDFYRFHSVLGFPDRFAYWKGQVKYFSCLKNAGKTYSASLACAFKILSKINPSFSFIDMIGLVCMCVYSKILKTFNLQERIELKI